MMMSGKARDTGPSPATRGLVWKRAQESCERCLRSNTTLDIHHRKPRRMGGTRDSEINSPCNLVLLCRECHRDVESRRDLATADGWILGATGDAGNIPIRLCDFGLVYLASDGTYVLDNQGE